MSTTLGAITSMVQDAIDDTSSETKAQIHRAVNRSYREIGLMHFWQGLLRYTTLGSTTLPGDLERIYYIEPADTDYLYFPSQITDRYTNSRLYNWYRNLTQTSPLLTGTDMVVTANSTTVTSATGGFTTADHASQYIRIGVDGGVYKISSVSDTNTLVLADAYRGASETAQYFEIRPVGTLILGRVDYNGEALTSTSDKLWYLCRPLPLYNDYDAIPLPGTCDPIRVMALQRMLEGDKYDNDAIKQDERFQASISTMKAMEPTLGRAPRARDPFGNPIRFGHRRGMVATDANDRRILGI